MLTPISIINVNIVIIPEVLKFQNFKIHRVVINAF